jgi:hypothetical protein
MWLTYGGDLTPRQTNTGWADAQCSDTLKIGLNNPAPIVPGVQIPQPTFTGSTTVTGGAGLSPLGIAFLAVVGVVVWIASYAVFRRFVFTGE